MFGKLRRLAFPVIAAGLVGLVSAAASGETILSLAPNPLSGGGTIVPGITQTGTGDITIVPATDQFIGSIVPVPLALAYTTDYGPLFNPLTLTINSFADQGNYITVVPGTFYVQNLTTGSFTLTDFGNNTVLAAGNITGASISYDAGSGAVLSGIFAYTSGQLYNELVNTGLPTNGHFSLSLTNETTDLSSGQFSGTSADITVGAFDVVAPLPATATTGLALLAGLGVIGGVSALRRRRTA